MTAPAHLARPEPLRRSHSVRAWANAKFFESMDWYLHRRLGARKRALFADLPQRVVELGSGAGASMRYLAPGTRLLAIEPNPHTHDALRRSAARYEIALDIRSERAESTGLATGSVDAVICTLVLCTVEDHRLRSRKCVASCVRADVSCSSSTLGPVRVRCAHCNACYVARGGTSSTVAASTATPRPRSRRPASQRCGPSTIDSVACSCPCGRRSVASQSHETHDRREDH